MTENRSHEDPGPAGRVAAFARGRGGIAERFMRHFYRRVPPGDVTGRSVESLHAAAEGMLDFMRDRAPDADKLRVRIPEAPAGGRPPHAAVELVTDDRPFIVDSIVEELNRRKIAIHLAAHPIFRVRRDAAGRLDDLHAHDRAGGEGPVESVVRLEIDRPATGEEGDALAARLRHVLHDVRLAVRDWAAMRGALVDAAAGLARRAPPSADLDESAAFLRWLADRHFTFLGSRRYDLRTGADGARLHGVPGTALGIMRRAEESDNASAATGRPVPPEALERLRGPHPLIVSKSARRSTVHRAIPMDSIEVKRHDDDGNVLGVHRFLGLFTSSARNRPPAEVPLLRRTVAAVRSRAGFPEDGHDDKALLHVLEALPRDELFQHDDDTLLKTGLGIMELRTRPRVRVFARRHAFEWAVSCLVFVPRERYGPGLRSVVTKLLEKAFSGTCEGYFIQVDDAPLARLYVIVKTEPGTVPALPTADIEAQLAAALSDWDESLAASLAEAHDGDTAARLARRYGAAFPSAYRERFAAPDAVGDIARMEAARRGDGLELHLHKTADDGVRLKIYRVGEQLALSDMLPTLENMGLHVTDEFPYRLDGGGGDGVWIHDLGVRDGTGGKIDAAAAGARIAAAFKCVRRGEAEDDAFNRLVLRAGLDWREAVVLRAYAKYLRQAKVPFSQAYMARTLADHPCIARRLADLFRARFDPAGAGDDAETAAAAGIETALEKVAGLDEDRVIRRFLNAVLSTVRTNFFQHDRNGARHAHLSLKIDSTRIDDLPPPRPAVEIFVYGARVEGIHLRGGKVARGGLRWSSRMEDYRTEILGLMKAQLVKNAVIVPVGAKGGFVVKQPPAGDRDAALAEGVACYRTFVSCLLDVTDNLVDGRAVAPREVRRRDGDDPYLVVAADKGTAAFSDIANEVAADYGFWLGDAFASGGSSGYDHKRMGITARGAWEAVKRHFRDMGRDTQAEPFTVVGIGDMSGDVFGNGMLLSRRIRLVGAFDHRHVFVDPGANAETGFAERRRLFGLARSSWADYDARLISSGGGVFDRGAKSIALTPEMRILLDLEGETATPNALISALLRAPVDLLWNGGIGTYVKASGETHADADDRANDGVRIDARDLRCKVVGEGGNLGLTQRARVEAARRGVRLNSDAIDNSAGVDCSDREVNIKILLGDVESAGELTRADRDALLAAMTDDVARRCLADNYLQALGIGAIEALGAERIDLQQRMMQSLERAGEIDRGVEALPDDEAIEALRAAGGGLTRPEISVLYAHAKISLYNALLDSELPDDDFLTGDLEGYFPPVLVERYRPFVRRHRLRREIVATAVANSLVNRASMAFALMAREETGRAAADVARAYIVVRAAFGLPLRWAEIETLDGKAPPAAQLETMAALRGLMEHSILWLLRHPPPRRDCGAAAALLGAGVGELAAGLDAVLPDDLRAVVAAAARGLADRGVPHDLARFAAAAARPLYAACAIVEAADRTGAGILDTAGVFFRIGRLLGLDWLRGEARSLAVSTVWQRRAASAIVDDLYGQQTALTVRAIEAGGSAEDWAAANRGAVSRTSRLLGDLRGQPRFDLAMLAVASRQTRDLLHG